VKAAAAAAYSLLCVESTPGRRTGAGVTPAAYLMLFVLGVLEGVIGCFQFSRAIGPVPAAALLLCVVIFVTCLLAGIGMGTPAGAFAPAAGWFAASFVLSLPTGGGSVIVTNTAAGMWYLYGGALCATAAVVASVVLRLRSGRR
jgi:Family of unknown function (DUF6113)